MPRGFSGINRISDEASGYEKESYDNLTPWMRRVVEQMARQQQNAVDQARTRQSIVGEINNIKATKPRYATVDDAVEDMRNRTGLNSYLSKIQQDDSNKFKKIVAEIRVEDEVPESLKKYDYNTIITYVKNYIDNVHGLSATVPQLQHDIEHLFRVDPSDVRTSEVEQFLSNLILEARSTVSPEVQSPYLGKNVGKEEVPQDDAFMSLMPASK